MHQVDQEFEWADQVAAFGLGWAAEGPFGERNRKKSLSGVLTSGLSHPSLACAVIIYENNKNESPFGHLISMSN